MALRGSAACRLARTNGSQVCKFWATSRCLNKNCRFLHAYLEQESIEEKGKSSQHPDSAIVVKSQKRRAVCKFWADGQCVRQERCPYLHTWFLGDDDFSYLTTLQGHKKGITGIVFPEKTNNLYSAAKDGTVRVWDSVTGKCNRVINLGAEACCLISEGVWVFCGASNLIKAWNIERNNEFTLLDKAVGQVHAMEVGDDMVFAGTEEGVIHVWKGKVCSDPNANPFHPHKTLRGHTAPVLSLRVGNVRLYSGSTDNTIRVWNMDTLECAMILNGHSGPVTSLICYDASLISCSLDHTIKAWCMGEGGIIEQVYSHSEEDGLLALSGMVNVNRDKSVLFCSSKDNSVGIYDLPSFEERGRLFAKRQVRGIQVLPVQGLFFTGDDSGELKVWKWSESAAKQNS